MLQCLSVHLEDDKWLKGQTCADRSHILRRKEQPAIHAEIAAEDEKRDAPREEEKKNRGERPSEKARARPQVNLGRSVLHQLMTTVRSSQLKVRREVLKKKLGTHYDDYMELVKWAEARKTLPRTYPFLDPEADRISPEGRFFAVSKTQQEKPIWTGHSDCLSSKETNRMLKYLPDPMLNLIGGKPDKIYTGEFISCIFTRINTTLPDLQRRDEKTGKMTPVSYKVPAKF